MRRFTSKIKKKIKMRIIEHVVKCMFYRKYFILAKNA